MQNSEGMDNSTEEMLGEKPGFSLPTCSWKCRSGTDAKQRRHGQQHRGNAG